MEELRLQKIIADRGYCSRRKAEELIQEGKVQVGGKTITEMGNKYPVDVDITIDGKILPALCKLSFTYLLFNKPIGVLTTLADDRGRKTIKDFIPRGYPRLFPVGRLDINSSGLLILTDDGDFANLVMHPSSELEKTYQVKITGLIREEESRKLRTGIRLDDGLTAPAKVKILVATDDYSLLDITIHEGKKREVRRMMEYLSHNVISLTRTKIGPIELNIKKGEIIAADPKDIELIRNICLSNKAKSSIRK